MLTPLSPWDSTDTPQIQNPEKYTGIDGGERKTDVRVVDVFDARVISDAERAVAQRFAQTVDRLSVSLVARVDVKSVTCAPVHPARMRTWCHRDP